MVPGRSYTLAGKYKGVRWFNGEVYISPRLYAGIEWLTASGSRISVKYVLNSTTVTNSNWVNFGGAHTAPTNAVKARIILFNYLSPNTEARFDNISLEEANQTYRYDANGNIIQDLNRNISSITYNRLNLPVRMVKTNGTVISYGYNWSGQRLWKITSGTDTTKYIRLASGSILGEWNTTNGGFSFISLAGVTSSSIGYRVLESGTWKRYFYITDHLGNIRNQVKETGAIVYAADYFPYGSVAKEWQGTLPELTKYKYQGKERDVESGYDYFEARTYDSQLGRFLQVDPHEFKYPFAIPTKATFSGGTIEWIYTASCAKLAQVVIVICYQLSLKESSKELSGIETHDRPHPAYQIF